MNLTRLPVKHILVSGIFIASIVGVWYSYKQTSSAFAANGLDLTIGNTSYYNGQVSADNTWAFADLDDGNGPSSLGRYLFFEFDDLKPGDNGQDTIQLMAQGSDYYACVDWTLTKDDDVSTNEPELAEGDDPEDNDDDFDGELGSQVQIVFWVDDGDGVFENDETVIDQGPVADVLDANWTLADSSQNIFDASSSALIAGNSYSIAKSWCFGNLSLDPLEQDGSSNARTAIDPEGPGVVCSGQNVTNIAQTDMVQTDVQFLSIQASENPEYTCGTCQIQGTFGADTVIDYSPTTRKNGDPIDPTRTDPTVALGLPEQTNASGTFTALGFGGTITLEFDVVVANQPGNDISIYEVTNGSTYPLETAQVQVSQDNSNYETLGTAVNKPSSISSFDLDTTSFDWIKYIRLTDTSDPADHTGPADGFDLDGIIVETVDVCE